MSDFNNDHTDPNSHPQTGSQNQQSKEDGQSSSPSDNGDLTAKIKEAQAKDEAQNQASQAMDEKEQKIKQLTETLQRCMADMQNMKRRAEEDRVKWAKFANVDLLKQLLPIVDNFNRACDQLPEELKENGWTKGVMQTHQDLLKMLERVGVKKMETIGQKLDPTKHEALMQGSGEKDRIIEEFDAGYIYHDQTLKPAKVKVGNGERE